jgi:signal transduction histidine kinase/CheY-like chemotaxis protein
VKQGIAVFDKHLKLICWNQQFAALLELPAELERVGAPLHEVVEAIESRCQSPGAALSAIEEKVRRIAIHQQPYQERFSEPLRIVEVHSARMPDAGVAVTFADVTERVLAAEALEARVAERTAELTRVNDELSLAKAQADEANLGKTRFIAAASHDILQPLNAARLFASSLVARQRNGKDSQLVRNLDSSLEAVEEILTTLLDISRLDAGALKPEISSFAIGELIETLALEHEPAAREKGLRLRRVHCGLDVATDRRLLRRVLQNLLSNAIKYTAAGGIVIGCRRRGKEVVIEVHDSGRGIPEEKLAVIFREFERLDAHKSNIPGLGLGLSIVERIAQMMQHDITVRSIPGRGTMISIAVPAAPAAAETGPVRARRAAHVPTLGHCRALVVDNEPAILDGMKTLLEGWGCTVHTAGSAAEALAISARAENQFDIIIADYHLGEDDGLSLIEHLRKLMGRQVAALLITADRSSDVVQAARRKQVVHMKKPIKPASLRAAMSHVLARMEAAE